MAEENPTPDLQEKVDPIVEEKPNPIDEKAPDTELLFIEELRLKNDLKQFLNEIEKKQLKKGK